RIICEWRATSARVALAEGQRFGLHNLRHSLSTWLVGKGEVDPKTGQGMLRHSDSPAKINPLSREPLARQVSGRTFKIFCSDFVPDACFWCFLTTSVTL